MTTLHQAARSGDLAMLRQLLDAGADLEERDETGGLTPLMSACLSPQACVATVELLLARGADVHACKPPQALPEINPGGLLESEDLDLGPEYREVLAAIEKSREFLRNVKPDAPALIELAVKESSPEIVRLLLAHGVDPAYRSAHGYSLLTTAACARRTDLLDLLLDAGSPLDELSDYGESALGVLSREGEFAAVAKLLAHGADSAPLQWTPLHHAVATGSVEETRLLLDSGADPEAVDGWNRTALLLAIHAGDTGKISLLLEHGANRQATGRCGRTALSFPCDRDDTRAMEFLLQSGFDKEARDEFGHTPLMDAAEHRAAGCFRVLLDHGADWQAVDRHGEGLLPKVSHPEMVAMLHARGADLARLEPEVLRAFLGLGENAELNVGEEQYLAGRFRRFGTANPERMDIPFWHAMVRCGWDAWQAAKLFDDCSFGRHNPVWCHRRFGMSLTSLPDGRFVQIAGEHEDHYDPDFCIYNDVFVHDGKGGLTIFGYPEEVFPPTDFHSATLVGPWIYLIGNLGYPATRQARAFRTPVHRLHTGDWHLEEVPTRGEGPRWLHSHLAELLDGRIRVCGGKIHKAPPDGEAGIEDNTGVWTLDLATFEWRREGDGDGQGY